MRTNTAARRLAQRAIGDAERVVESAARAKVEEMRLEIADLEDSVDAGHADLDRRLTNIEFRDAERLLAAEEKSGQKIVTP